MKLIVITNGNGPEMREAIQIADDIIIDGSEVEKIDWERDELTTLASLYDIYDTPALLIVSDDGSLIEKWQGSNLPLVSDVKHLLK